jgi:hypothetical protein
MKGSKYWLVSKVLRALDLILLTRLYIRVLLIIRLVPTIIHAILELSKLLDALWGLDESLRAGSRHKGSWEIGDLRASASISSRSWLVRLEIYYVTQVEIRGSERHPIRRERACRERLLLLLLLVLLLILHI